MYIYTHPPHVGKHVCLIPCPYSHKFGIIDMGFLTTDFGGHDFTITYILIMEILTADFGGHDFTITYVLDVEILTAEFGGHDFTITYVLDVEIMTADFSGLEITITFVIYVEIIIVAIVHLSTPEMFPVRNCSRSPPSVVVCHVGISHHPRNHCG